MTRSVEHKEPPVCVHCGGQHQDFMACAREARGHTVLTSAALDEAYAEADRRMKYSNGHSYVTILKTRCQYCGRSPSQTGRCRAWFQTFTEELRHVLRERHYLSDEQHLTGEQR